MRLRVQRGQTELHLPLDPLPIARVATSSMSSPFSLSPHFGPMTSTGWLIRTGNGMESHRQLIQSCTLYHFLFHPVTQYGLHAQASSFPLPPSSHAAAGPHHRGGEVRRSFPSPNASLRQGSDSPPLLMPFPFRTHSV